MRRGGKKKKRKEGKRKGKERKEREEKKRRIKGERKMEKRKSAFQRSELVRPRGKVCIFDEGASRGKDSSYFGLFSTITVVGLCLFPKGLFDRISKYGNATLV